MKKLLTVIAIAALTSCSSGNDFKKGKKILEQQGYTDVKNTGYNWFCCGKDDGYSTGFKAKDKAGNSVEGCFCSSVGKGVTVRFE
jgi:rhodanese-related sulfurtransferase